MVPKKLSSWVREQNERPRMPAEQREGGIQAPASPPLQSSVVSFSDETCPQVLNGQKASIPILIPESALFLCRRNPAQANQTKTK